MPLSRGTGNSTKIPKPTDRYFARGRNLGPYRCIGKPRMTSSKDAFTAAGLNGKLATHSLRKSFAQRVYEQSGDIFLVQELLGHKSVSTTQRYLGVDWASAREAVEGMALASESYKMNETSESFQFLGGSLKKETDETLFLELALRGYDLSRPLRPDDEVSEAPSKNAEIVKIG